MNRIVAAVREDKGLIIPIILSVLMAVGTVVLFAMKPEAGFVALICEASSALILGAMALFLRKLV